ncbi:ATP-binding protein [Jeotgalibacillus salarius]|uniref:ATP-binding protein n=1 Tax=Jeotgalibacillus salarius TaxID=546023 RepID=UPI00141A79CA|nr:ATP-binding protein [Jeotgalibacillus salarius]
MTDQNGIILNFNEQSKQYFEMRAGIKIYTYLKPEHVEWLKSCMMNNKADEREIQLLFVDSDHECTCEFIPVTGEERFILIFKDINKGPEDEIFTTIFDKAIHGLMLINANGSVVRSNLFANKLLNLQNGRKVNIYRLLDEYETEKNIPGFDQQFAPQATENIVSDVIKIRSHYFEFTKVNEISQGYDLIVIRDISEVVEYMRRVDHQDTLKVVGQLAAGIAHEIRNPMTSLKGFIQLLEPNLKDHQKMYFEVINSELKRIETIMTEFLMLAKPKNTVFEKINLTRVLADTVDMMKPQAILHDVDIKFNARQSEHLTFGDANRLKQVFINLIKNALEAMPDKGEIFVSVETSGNQHLISVKDNGCGIPEEKLNKLNEPFFTTKVNGTGLGLPVSLKIIEEHQGTVNVISRLYEGTEFKIGLPLME